MTKINFQCRISIKQIGDLKKLFAKKQSNIDKRQWREQKKNRICIETKLSNLARAKCLRKATIALVNSRWLYSMVDVCATISSIYTYIYWTNRHYLCNAARIHFMIINQYGKPFCCIAYVVAYNDLSMDHIFSVLKRIYFFVFELLFSAKARRYFDISICIKISFTWSMYGSVSQSDVDKKNIRKRTCFLNWKINILIRTVQNHWLESKNPEQTKRKTNFTARGKIKLSIGYSKRSSLCQITKCTRSTSNRRSMVKMKTKRCWRQDRRQGNERNSSHECTNRKSIWQKVWKYTPSLCRVANK